MGSSKGSRRVSLQLIPQQRSDLMGRVLSIAASAFLVLSSAAACAVKVGDPAPVFTGTDNNGKMQALSTYKGKYVVLEWSNRDCPYTRKHYSSGNMQLLQKEWIGKGVVWLTIISSAPGQEGYVTAGEE